VDKIDENEAAVREKTAAPLYAGVKQMIVGRIRNGDWPPRHRIPSENELVNELGVSRMTVNRALRELALEGVLARVQGLGTFVAEGKGQSSIVEVKNISDEIAARGHFHSARIVLLDTLKASPEIAEALNISVGERTFHSILVHSENDIPVQLEDRYVNAEIVPDYGDQDFTKVTPNQYLSSVVAWTEAEHEIEAVLPAGWEARLLAVGRTEPCIQIRRRTFAGAPVVTAVRLVIPGGRYRLRSRQHATGASAHFD
jgi:GntR family histidine utilization transcriptional repressor